ncbi:hypothetical protein BGZ65_002977 [Modicella reniformis]|uniref:HCP-like protein n=1 Tax=Modicella reniformis TaxID=1440133 RepID=A0A9P6SVA8_9FUNG|nr:hypothetical protein BGZ65_002977 [Modicella reniformis]
MIRNSAASTVSGAHVASGTAAVVRVTSTRSTVARPRRRPGTHAAINFKPPSMREFNSSYLSTRPDHILLPVGHQGARRGLSRTTSNTSANLTHPKVNKLTTFSASIPSTFQSSFSSISFSTSTSFKKKEKTMTEEDSHQLHMTFMERIEPGRNPATTTQTTKIESDVIYRKEGSNIVPVTPGIDQIEMPGLTRPSVTSAPLEVASSKTTNNESVDLKALTIRDVLPPDNLVQQLIQQRKLNVTVDETKELVQMVLDVLPLDEKDPKRFQVEKEFLKVCRKKQVPAREMASWALQYTRDGAPLAFVLLKMSVDHGDIFSRYSYGAMLYRGARGVPADPVKGRAIIESMAKPSPSSPIHPLPWAMSTLATIYARDDGNFEAARDMYLAAANAGVVEARVALGRMYLSGELPRNIAKAKKCFELAVKMDDNGEAHFLLGVLEMSEKKPNISAAFQHYQKAASKGLPEAQYNLGLAYFQGVGVPKNDALAIEYWKMSGQQGFGLAQLSLGAYYFQNETTQEQKDPKTGEIKVIKHEWDPTKKDLMQAQKWFTLASRRLGQLGLEGKRLKAHVDEAIKKGGGRSRDGHACTIL